MDGSWAAYGEGCRLVPLFFDWCEAISQILRIRIRTRRPPFSTRGQVQHVPILTGHKREDAETTHAEIHSGRRRQALTHFA